MSGGEKTGNTENDRPPVFKSWKGWYWLVISVLVAQIIIYTLVSNSFR